MARGADEKISVGNKILETFDGSFQYGKEIRIPIGDVQIKVTLTCAKDNVEIGGDTALPGETPAKEVTRGHRADIKPTQEEKERVSSLLQTLGLS